MKFDKWQPDDLFQLLDSENKGWVSVFDIEKLLINHKRNTRALTNDIELLIAMYDRSGQSSRILLKDFIQKLGSV